MAYNNYFPMNYSSFGNYIPQVNTPMPAQNQAQQNNGIIWVQGEAGAKSYLVAPNTSVTLWDTESQTIYVKSADATGLPSMKVLDYTMRDGAPQMGKILAENDYATKEDVLLIRSEIDALKAKFDDMKGAKK